MADSPDNRPVVRWICQGCQRPAESEAPLPFRCENANADDDVDHLMTAVWERPLDLATVDDDPNPFIAFREGLYSYALAMQHGMSDEAYVAMVRELDQAVAEVDGTGFRITPWGRSEALGIDWKDETGNVAGSHKARHLFGVVLAIEVAERTRQIASGEIGSRNQPLAIASCGNAAFAAAVIAKAWGRSLRVFIPDHADPAVVERLKNLGADIVTCVRAPDAPPGDPCFHRFRDAIHQGATPFTCQGTENGLVIDGGMTLGYEVAREIAKIDFPRLENLFIQVGGGALASATIQGLDRVLSKERRFFSIHAVQTAECAPLYAAWSRLSRGLWETLVAAWEPDPKCRAVLKMPEDPSELARELLGYSQSNIAETFFRSALEKRSDYMHPVDSPGFSVATGILDDETYDWFVVARGMIQSGGWPIVVTEPDLLEARTLAQTTLGVPADATGSAGLAGLLAARKYGADRAPIHGIRGRNAVLLTGREHDLDSP